MVIEQAPKRALRNQLLIEALEQDFMEFMPGQRRSGIPRHQGALRPLRAAAESGRARSRKHQSERGRGDGAGLAELLETSTT